MTRAARLLTLCLLPLTSRCLLAPQLARPRAPRTTGLFGPRAPRRTTALAGAASSLHARINAFGLSLKDRGARQRELMGATERKSVLLLRAAAMMAIYSAFVAYRAYRGFFVLVPTVYGEVWDKVMQTAADERFEISGIEVVDDIDPGTGKLRMRSRIVMNLFALGFVATLLVTKTVSLLGKLAALGSKPETAESRLAARELELDLPPLPDIPDMPPDTDELPVPL